MSAAARGLPDHYENMLAERMSQASGLRDDFHEFRTKLRWKIDRYKNASGPLPR